MCSACSQHISVAGLTTIATGHWRLSESGDNGRHHEYLFGPIRHHPGRSGQLLQSSISHIPCHEIFFSRTGAWLLWPPERADGRGPSAERVTPACIVVRDLNTSVRIPRWLFDEPQPALQLPRSKSAHSTAATCPSLRRDSCCN